RKKDYNKALEFIEKATILTPDDPQISNFKLQIYDNLGRSNEVLKTLEELVKAEPNNKVVLTQYASGLSKAKKQDEAIKYYEKALSIDPNYDIALYNIAAEYKNKASEIQKTEKEKREKDAKYKENESLYFPI
ncbi:MAG TPA: tetratricopeptide repeat protein, partial [Candidatus Kapabacteria bacterium]|nr:tetratricopeptide repeat protein [Candidatus Kapabacteria bacterium]